MDEFYKQDIFFFVTTIAVVLITLFLLVAAAYFIKILKDIRYISEKAKQESDFISQDLHQLRDNVKEQGFKVKHAFNFFNSFYKRHKK